MLCVIWMQWDTWYPCPAAVSYTDPPSTIRKSSRAPIMGGACMSSYLCVIKFYCVFPGPRSYLSDDRDWGAPELPFSSQRKHIQYKIQLYPPRKILQSTFLEDKNEGMSFRLSQLSFSEPNKITINWIAIERITTWNRLKFPVASKCVYYKGCHLCSQFSVPLEDKCGQLPRYWSTQAKTNKQTKNQKCVHTFSWVFSCQME